MSNPLHPVICFGEALIDFLNSGHHQSDGLMIQHFQQFPGGAPANVAVAIAKLGGNARFIGQVGSDMFGDFLLDCLRQYGVDTSGSLQHPTAPTALAFVALDEHGERSFSFYRDRSADVLLTSEQIDDHLLRDGRIFHLCSNTLTTPQICVTTEGLLQRAAEAGLLVSMDVNLRHNLWPAGQAEIAVVNAVVAQAQVLKFSREEYDYLYHGDEQYIAQLLAEQARLIVITDDGRPITFYTRNGQGTIEAPKVDVVDTTCGGDAFSGGLLWQLSRLDDPIAVLADPQQVEKIIAFAARCGAHTVTRPGAFPALPVAADVCD
ncbi:carbohydrate kinase [Aestuariibacter halophilus]|uniref:Carbohydrate kinase n=1 Tax=Fluctibacter halophilus TaxID=226011 RepID=A0ABS8GEN4_9ALTE|nr:carbohydrate kinase [Aestuariibacter halophilus]MCC2617671.1 carbohydrate kinase [Aestuariibacter halophilus]